MILLFYPVRKKTRLCRFYGGSIDGNQGHPRHIASATALARASVGTCYPGLDLRRPIGGDEGGELMGGEAMSQVGILSHEVAQLRFTLGPGDDDAAGFVLFRA